MVIDFNKLDKRKSYILLEYGTSLVSKLIDKFTKDYYPSVPHRPSHVLALKYNGYCWQIFESHLQPTESLESGVRTYSQFLFEAEFPKIIKSTGVVYPFPTDIKKLKSLLGQPYGVGDILSLGKAYFLDNNGEQKNRDGYICSEYLATANKDIQKYFSLKPHCITPAHFLRYLEENNVKPITF